MVPDDVTDFGRPEVCSPRNEAAEQKKGQFSPRTNLVLVTPSGDNDQNAARSVSNRDWKKSLGTFFNKRFWKYWKKNDELVIACVNFLTSSEKNEIIVIGIVEQLF